MYKRNGLKIGLCVALALSASVGSTSLPVGQAIAVTTQVQDPSRLAKSIVPTNYKLLIEPLLDKGVFYGRERIAVHVLGTHREIVLNGLGLNIKNATIQRKSAEFHEHRKHLVSKPMPVKVEYLAAREQVKFICPEEIVPGSYELNFEFEGKFDDKLRGFFLAKYKSDGVQKSIACTQMEPTDARRMFVCFDEPEFKSSYNLSVIIDKNLTAISNSAVAAELPLVSPRMTYDGFGVRPSSGETSMLDKKLVSFKQTPKISSYLLALVVGDLASSEEKVADGVTIRIWALKGKEAMGGYALDTAAKLLPYMNRYFGVAYPIKKLDLIAIPDFGPGAMENLGAITFKESALLIDDKTASINSKQVVAEVIAHEMAHQWFGDLVTTRWWDDIWLNEAFASWFGTKSVDFLRPDWRLWDGFGRHSLNTDSLKSTRAIHANVKSPEQAIEMFDDITYGKGSAILRMLELYVGDKVFQRGVHLYMKTHAFKTATTEDLWWAIAQASSKPIPEMMHSWVYQPGYPLVSVGSAGNQLNLSQQRYFLDSTIPPVTTKWMIPVAFKWLEKDTSATTEMFDQAKKVVNCPKPNASVFVNADAQGFYRVSYDANLLKKIEQSLYVDLTPNERYALLSDMSSLVYSLRQPIAAGLRLTLLCKGEEDPFVLPSITGRIASVRKYVNVPTRPSYQQYVQSLLLPQKQRLGWEAKEGESDLVADARASVLSTLGTYGQHKPTIAEAKALFAKYRADRTSIAPNLVHVVLNIVSYNGQAAEYEQIKQLWQTAKSPEEEETALMMLTNFQKPELIQRTLAMALSNQVRTQDRPRGLSLLLSSDAGKRIAWSFIKLHWSDIVAKCPPMALDHIAGACRSLDTAADEKDLRAFFAAHKVPAIQSEINRMLEDVRLAVRFRERNGTYINNYIRDKQWQK